MRSPATHFANFRTRTLSERLPKPWVEKPQRRHFSHLLVCFPSLTDWRELFEVQCSDAHSQERTVPDTKGAATPFRMLELERGRSYCEVTSHGHAAGFLSACFSEGVESSSVAIASLSLWWVEHGGGSFPLLFAAATLPVPCRLASSFCPTKQRYALPMVRVKAIQIPTDLGRS